MFIVVVYWCGVCGVQGGIYELLACVTVMVVIPVSFVRPMYWDSYLGTHGLGQGSLHLSGGP